MFCVNPVILPVKLPVPLPLVVWLVLIVGLWLVLQQTPLAVTVVFPSFVTFPPQVAELDVILLTVEVVTVGSVVVVNVRSSPYAVPTLFVAYALT